MLLRTLRLTVFLLLGALLSACGYNMSEVPPSSPEVVAKSVYRHSGPPGITLFTAISNSTGEGAHSALMINASQRVIFDPAGTFRKEGAIIEMGDVLYGATPHMVDSYTRFHARETYHVVVQQLDLPREAAEAILQDAMSYGDVIAAYCTSSTSTVLSRAELPGKIRVTMLPKALMKQFGQLPGVETRELFEYDDGDRFKALEAYDPARVAADLKQRRIERAKSEAAPKVN